MHQSLALKSSRVSILDFSSTTSCEIYHDDPITIWPRTCTIAAFISSFERDIGDGKRYQEARGPRWGGGGKGGHGDPTHVSPSPPSVVSISRIRPSGSSAWPGFASGLVALPMRSPKLHCRWPAEPGGTEGRPGLDGHRRSEASLERLPLGPSCDARSPDRLRCAKIGRTLVSLQDSCPSPRRTHIGASSSPAPPGQKPGHVGCASRVIR